MNNSMTRTQLVCAGLLQIEIFGNKLSGLSLLTHLIFARQRTQINAALFHSYHLDEVKDYRL